jgi:hypothetical protein
MCIVISWISLIHFIIRRKFFSHLFYIPVCCYTVSSFFFFQSLNSVLLTKLPFLSVVIFYFQRKDTDRGSTHSSQPHDAYYLLQNIKMENSNSNGGQMKPSIKSADMKEVCHQKTTTNKSSSRARVISSLQNFRKSNQQTLLRRKTNRLF